MYDLITIGDAVIDTHVNIDNASVECDVDTRACKLCLDYASKIPITNSFQTLGGNAANVACGAARLGMDTAIVSSLGKDSNGRLVIDELKRNKVSTSLVERDPKTQTRYAVVLNFRGERTILSYHARRSYHFPKKMPPTGWIYYTSMSEGFELLQDKLIEFLDEHKSVKLVFNPGSFQLKSALDRVLEILPKTDILVINLQEAERMLNTSLEKEKTVSALIHGLVNLGAKEVIITDAANGATAGNADEVWNMATYPVKVVAKTGAGDAFSAGYIAARHFEHDIHTALIWGMANSTGVITEHGPQKGQLDQPGIQKMADKFPNIKPKRLM
jgi:sugar/nucleoside kinase (ribokinase family)